MQAPLGDALAPALPFKAPALRQHDTVMVAPKQNETVLLGRSVVGEVPSGTVMLPSQPVPAMLAPFTLAPAQDAGNAAAVPFMPLDTFAEVAVALMEGRNPLPIFAALGLNPVQYMQCSGAFYERAAKDPAFQRELDLAMARARERRR